MLSKQFVVCLLSSFRIAWGGSPRLDENLWNKNKPTACYYEKTHYLRSSETAISEMNVSDIKRKEQGYEIF